MGTILQFTGKMAVLHIETMEYFGKIYIDYNHGVREEIANWIPNENPMVQETQAFVDFVKAGNTVMEYRKTKKLTTEVIALMEKIRAEAGIKFSKDVYRV